MATSLGKVVVSTLKIVINFPRTYKELLVKENLIGSLVSKIHRYKQTQRLIPGHPFTEFALQKLAYMKNCIKVTSIFSFICKSIKI